MTRVGSASRSLLWRTAGLLLVALHCTTRVTAGQKNLLTVVLETVPDHVETICINNTKGITTFALADTLLVGSTDALDDGNTLCAEQLEYMAYENGGFTKLAELGPEWENVGWRIPLLSKRSNQTLNFVVNNNIESDMIINSLPTPPVVVEGGWTVLPSKFKVATTLLGLWKDGLEDMVTSYVASRWAEVTMGPPRLYGALLVRHFEGRSDGLVSRVAQLLLMAGAGNLEMELHEVEYYTEANRRRRLLQAAPVPALSPEQAPSLSDEEPLTQEEEAELYLPVEPPSPTPEVDPSITEQSFLASVEEDLAAPVSSPGAPYPAPSLQLPSIEHPPISFDDPPPAGMPLPSPSPSMSLSPPPPSPPPPSPPPSPPPPSPPPPSPPPSPPSPPLSPPPSSPPPPSPPFSPPPSPPPPSQPQSPPPPPPRQPPPSPPPRPPPPRSPPPPRPPPPATSSPPPPCYDYYYCDGYYNPNAVGCRYVCIRRSPVPSTCKPGSSTYPSCLYLCYCQ